MTPLEAEELQQHEPFQFRISDDKTIVELAFGSHVMTLKAAHIEHLIASLAQIRAGLVPAVPVAAPFDYRPVHQLDYLHTLLLDPGRPPLEGGALVVGRSPGLGWVQFDASPDFCMALHQWLAGKAATVTPPPGSTLN